MKEGIKKSVMNPGCLEQDRRASKRALIEKTEIREKSREYVVHSVLPDSPAQKAGLCHGEIIKTINGEIPPPFEELSAFVNAKQGDALVLAAAGKGGKTRRVILQPTRKREKDPWMLGLYATNQFRIEERFDDGSSREYVVERVPLRFPDQVNSGCSGFVEKEVHATSQYGKRIFSVKVHGKGEDGLPRTLDLLQTYNPEGVRVFENRDTDSAGSTNGRTIIIGDMLRRGSIPVLLHEFMHAQQFASQRFSGLFRFYASPTEESEQDSSASLPSNERQYFFSHRGVVENDVAR